MLELLCSLFCFMSILLHDLFVLFCFVFFWFGLFLPFSASLLVVWIRGVVFKEWFPINPLQDPGVQIPKPPIQTTNTNHQSKPAIGGMLTFDVCLMFFGSKP